MNYTDILKETAHKEIFSIAIIAVVVLVITALVCVSLGIVNSRIKKSKTTFIQKSLRKNTQKGILGLILLVLLTVSILISCSFDTVKRIRNIYKDIDEESYVTYSGDYYISCSAANPPAPTIIDVDLDNGETLYLYANMFEWVTTLDGEYTGKVIYGKNSQIVVDISGL